jgi:DNA-binding MarR family transcriptional regulator
MTGGRSAVARSATAVAKAGIIADFRAAMSELKCIGSERLVRQGISMTQLHVMNMLERHGEMAMSRLAEMLDVSDSNATGLIDRIEERGFVERIRVPSDRRVVLVRITDRGREVMEEVETLREEMLERMLGRLDEPNLMRVAAAMSDLREAIVTTVADPNSGVSHTHEPQGRD